MKSINLSIIVKEIVQLPKTTSPKNYSIVLNNEPKRDIVFALPKIKLKKNMERKKHISYCSSGIGFARVVVAASSITSAMIMASSVTFSAVVSKR